METKVNEELYLDEHVFYGLKNLNDGFDAPTIKYFTAKDFEIVLHRVKGLGLGVLGIEPWKNGEFYDVATCEDYTYDGTNIDWYFKAFERFRNEDENLQFSASYSFGSIE